MRTIAVFAAICGALTATDTASMPAAAIWFAVAICALATRIDQ